MCCVQCLCLAPTYELALQIGQVTEKMAKFMLSLKIRYAVRGAERGKPAVLWSMVMVWIWIVMINTEFIFVWQV